MLMLLEAISVISMITHFTPSAVWLPLYLTLSRTKTAGGGGGGGGETLAHQVEALEQSHQTSCTTLYYAAA